jgi:Sec-independent protein translocase protein TatA
VPAFLGNLSTTEILVVGIVAVLIFGKRLPEVASQTFGQLRRLRQGMDQFRRETGIDREMRAIEHTMGDLQREATIDPRPAPSAPAPVHRAADPVLPTPLRPLPAPVPPPDAAGETPPATAGEAPPSAPGPATPQESEPG